MDALMLCYRDEPLREFPLGGRPVEVGSGAGCDIVVHDPTVAARHLVVCQKDGAPVVYDVSRGPMKDAEPVRLAFDEPIRLGRHHTIVRIADAVVRPRRATPCTEPMSFALRSPQGLVLVVGRGTGARRVRLDGWPVQVGSGPDNDLVLSDRAVSKRHCRIELTEDGVLVQDLGSRNGTWVDGMRVVNARIGAGNSVRIGRTDLHVVARGSRGDARDVGLIAASAAMLRVLGEVEQLSRLSWPVLVNGESGAGKEGVARALHERGPRRERPFVAVNAGGLPRDLIESELFGHEKGAFTGAAGVRRGVFEQAHGGTLFLDEVGELPLDMQTRLLRVLETWEVRRIGSESAVPVDVRLVCATHRDLRAMVAAGDFREDLYYRIARLVIEVPALRDRPDDVRALSEHFLRGVADELGQRHLTEDAMARLLSHSWPGNARELRNVICAAAASTPSQRIEVADVDRALAMLAGPGAWSDPSAQQLLEVIESHRGNLSAAARALGMPRTTLRDRLKTLRPTRPAAEIRHTG